MQEFSFSCVFYTAQAQQAQHLHLVVKSPPQKKGKKQISQHFSKFEHWNTLLSDSPLWCHKGDWWLRLVLCQQPQPGIHSALWDRITPFNDTWKPQLTLIKRQQKNKKRAFFAVGCKQRANYTGADMCVFLFFWTYAMLFCWNTGWIVKMWKLL